MAETTESLQESEVDPDLAAAIEADQKDAQKDQPAPRGVAGSTGTMSSNSMNPDISFIMTVGAGGYINGNILNQGGHNINDNGFILQGLEFGASGSVDPFFRYDMKFELAHLHLEEVVLSTLALPLNMQMRAGLMFARFGRQNELCLHTWSYVNAPLSHSRFLSEEHFKGTGVEWSVLLPTPWYSMVLVEMMSTDTISDFNSSTFGTSDKNLSGKTDSFDDLMYLGRLENFFELSNAWSLLIGNSAAFGQSGYGDNRATLFGSDLTLKWTGGETFVKWTTEGLLRQTQIPLASAEDWGGYSQVDLQITRRWMMGVRGDYADMLSGPESATDLFGGQEARGSLALTFFPTHFSKIRLQGDVLSAEGVDSLSYGGFLQVEVIAGAHAPHSF